MPTVVNWRNLRPFSKIIVASTNVTLLSSDNGALVVSNGSSALTHTLPALAPNLSFWFYNAVNQDMTVKSATTSNIVTFNSTGATNVIFNTVSQKTGACLFVFSNEAGNLWYAMALGPNTITTS